MKTNIPLTLQYSGYPLRVVEDNVDYSDLKSSTLKVISRRKETQAQVPVNLSPKAIDPKNWDADWFSNYE